MAKKTPAEEDPTREAKIQVLKDRGIERFFPHKTDRAWKHFELPWDEKEADEKIRLLLSYQYEKEAVLALKQRMWPEDSSPLATSYPGSAYISGYEVCSNLGIRRREIVDLIQAGDLVPLKNEFGRAFKEYEIPEAPGELYSPEEQEEIIKNTVIVPRRVSKAPPPIPDRIGAGLGSVTIKKNIETSAPQKPDAETGSQEELEPISKPARILSFYFDEHENSWYGGEKGNEKKIRGDKQGNPLIGMAMLKFLIEHRGPFGSVFCSLLNNLGKEVSISNRGSQPTKRKGRHQYTTTEQVSIMQTEDWDKDEEKGRIKKWRPSEEEAKAYLKTRAETQIEIDKMEEELKGCDDPWNVTYYRELISIAKGQFEDDTKTRQESERVRASVTKAIDRAIERIHRDCEELKPFINRQTIDTGLECRFLEERLPEPIDDWQLDPPNV